MKKIVLLISSMLIGGIAKAEQTLSMGNEEIHKFNQLIQPIEPSYIRGAYYDMGWDDNWFLNVQGGISAFTGTPVGHEDFFGRITPLLNVSLGKFITPKVGFRIAYQGLKLKDADIMQRTYQNLHADFLYNVASHSRYDRESLPKWDFIPYVGIGLIHNAYTHQKPFAFSYGILTRYRVAERFHITAELGRTTTYQNFDGQGKSDAFGDHLWQLSVGLSATIGKVGWKRVIDPMPYIHQNDLMKEYLYQYIMKENKKIKDIQQQLEQTDERSTPKNNYSGILALRERIKNRNKWIESEGDLYGSDSIPYKSPVKKTDTDKDTSFVSQYLSFLQEGQEQVGSPVFFFFKLNTSLLTEEAQMVNVEAIAKVINDFGLSAHIIGAADSQTGKADRNKELGQERAESLANMLIQKYNVDEYRISIYNAGGISTYKPMTANRNACVILYRKH